jgi:predicted nucleic acid-binding protein
MLRIYVDVCCLNRPFDNQTQDRIRLEAEAVILILKRFEVGEWQWVSSEVVDFEIEQTPDAERRLRVKLLTTLVHESVLVEQAEAERAEQLEKLGFDAYDALHIACAESGRADIFLTTDDPLLRRAHRLAQQLHVRVENPLTWLKEVTEK